MRPRNSFLCRSDASWHSDLGPLLISLTWSVVQRLRLSVSCGKDELAKFNELLCVKVCEPKSSEVCAESLWQAKSINVPWPWPWRVLCLRRHESHSIGPAYLTQWKHVVVLSELASWVFRAHVRASANFESFRAVILPRAFRQFCNLPQNFCGKNLLQQTLSLVSKYGFWDDARRGRDSKRGLKLPQNSVSVFQLLIGFLVGQFFVFSKALDLAQGLYCNRLDGRPPKINRNFECRSSISIKQISEARWP